MLDLDTKFLKNIRILFHVFEAYYVHGSITIFLDKSPLDGSCDQYHGSCLYSPEQHFLMPILCWVDLAAGSILNKSTSCRDSDTLHQQAIMLATALPWFPFTDYASYTLERNLFLKKNI